MEHGDRAIAVRLYTMPASEDMVETGRFLMLEGNVPDNARLGQRVRTGCSHPEGLCKNVPLRRSAHQQTAA